MNIRMSNFATVLLVALVVNAGAEQRYPVRGLILKVDPAHKTMVVSCDAIPNYMGAMAMPFSVRDSKELQGFKSGDMIDFSLIVEKDSSYAETLKLHHYEGLEPDPVAARRLKLLEKAVSTRVTKPVGIGEAVLDFSLISQDGHAITLSKLRGSVVVLNFIYTRCALPNFCFRSSNNFGNLQARFRTELQRRDLVLLTITFDPAHDDRETLAKYARIWKADPRWWHFLTGKEADIRRVCDLFGEDYYQDEGLMDHSLHTAVLDRNGRLMANLEGNEFSAAQLGDLVQFALRGAY